MAGRHAWRPDHAHRPPPPVELIRPLEALGFVLLFLLAIAFVVGLLATAPYPISA